MVWGGTESHSELYKLLWQVLGLIWRAVKISPVKTITAWTGTHQDQLLPERLAFLFVNTNQTDQIWPSCIQYNSYPFHTIFYNWQGSYKIKISDPDLRQSSGIGIMCCVEWITFLIEDNIILNSKLWTIVNFMVSCAEMHNNCNSAIKHSTNVVKNWIIVSPPVKSWSQAWALLGLILSPLVTYRINNRPSVIGVSIILHFG